MIQLQRGTVSALHDSWPGVLELEVAVDADTSMRALAYVELVGPVRVGQQVLLNTTALARNLGTGGFAFVVANLDSSDHTPCDDAAMDSSMLAAASDATAPATMFWNSVAGPGHLVKARYTPLQTMVLSVDEQESSHHELLQKADSIEGMPVVVADLHSSLPAIIAGARHYFTAVAHPQFADDRDLRIVYIMTDGGALPLWFSRTVAQLVQQDLLTATITCGQAFGGDLEAVSLHSALLAARVVCRADLVIVAQGPGNLGTDTKWGFSGVSAGDAINAVAALEGSPIATLRMSQADRRDRHLGLSHHSVTAYGRVALQPADLVMPASPRPLPRWWHSHVEDRLEALVEPSGRHRLVHIDDVDFTACLTQFPIRFSTMGRTLADDELAFTAAAAAGWWGAKLAVEQVAAQ